MEVRKPIWFLTYKHEGVNNGRGYILKNMSKKNNWIWTTNQYCFCQYLKIGFQQVLRIKVNNYFHRLIS